MGTRPRVSDFLVDLGSERRKRVRQKALATNSEYCSPLFKESSATADMRGGDEKQNEKKNNKATDLRAV